MNDNLPEHKSAASFGIIPIYKDKSGYKIVIVQNSKGGHWGLPKGTPENNETPLETAKRELWEETGILTIDIQEIPTFQESYSFEKDGVIYDKTNTYYIGYVKEMLSSTKLDEINEMRWVSFEEAKTILTHEQVIHTVEQVEQYVSLGRVGPIEKFLYSLNDIEAYNKSLRQRALHRLHIAPIFVVVMISIVALTILTEYYNPVLFVGTMLFIILSLIVFLSPKLVAQRKAWNEKNVDLVSNIQTVFVVGVLLIAIIGMIFNY